MPPASVYMTNAASSPASANSDDNNKNKNNGKPMILQREYSFARDIQLLPKDKTLHDGDSVTTFECIHPSNPCRNLHNVPMSDWTIATNDDDDEDRWTGEKPPPQPRLALLVLDYQNDYWKDRSDGDEAEGYGLRIQTLVQETLEQAPDSVVYFVSTVSFACATKASSSSKSCSSSSSGSSSSSSSKRSSHKKRKDETCVWGTPGADLCTPPTLLPTTTTIVPNDSNHKTGKTSKNKAKSFLPMQQQQDCSSTTTSNSWTWQQPHPRVYTAFQKQWSSGFLETALHARLQANFYSSDISSPVTHLLLAGPEASVAATARSAFRLGYQVLLSDAVTTTGNNLRPSRRPPASSLHRTFFQLAPYCQDVMAPHATIASVYAPPQQSSSSLEQQPKNDSKNNGQKRVGKRTPLLWAFPWNRNNNSKTPSTHGPQAATNNNKLAMNDRLVLDGCIRLLGLGAGDSVILPDVLESKHAVLLLQAMEQLWISKQERSRTKLSAAASSTPTKAAGGSPSRLTVQTSGLELADNHHNHKGPGENDINNDNPDNNDDDGKEEPWSDGSKKWKTMIRPIQRYVQKLTKLTFDCGMVRMSLPNQNDKETTEAWESAITPIAEEAGKTLDNHVNGEYHADNKQKSPVPSTPPPVPSLMTPTRKDKEGKGTSTTPPSSITKPRNKALSSSSPTTPIKSNASASTSATTTPPPKMEPKAATSAAPRGTVHSVPLAFPNPTDEKMFIALFVLGEGRILALDPDPHPEMSDGGVAAPRPIPQRIYCHHNSMILLGPETLRQYPRCSLQTRRSSAFVAPHAAITLQSTRKPEAATTPRTSNKTTGAVALTRDVAVVVTEETKTAVSPTSTTTLARGDVLFTMDPHTKKVWTLEDLVRQDAIRKLVCLVFVVGFLLGYVRAYVGSSSTSQMCPTFE